MTTTTLDNPVFAGRFRDFGRGSHFRKPAPKPSAGVISDVTQLRTRSLAPVALPVTPRQAPSEVLLRTATSQPKPITVKKSRSVSQKVTVVMALAVFIAGSAVAVLGWKTNQHVKAQVTSNTSAASRYEEDKPSSSAIANYRVDPSLPRYIRISKLNVFARVTRQGLDKKGAIKAPSNVHDVGWYENSSKPGEGGAVVLDSHVSGPTTRGAFYNIKNLTAGDEVEVERGDGQKFTYRVVRQVVSDADKVDMASALVSAETGKPGLNMITCAGAFDAKTQSYQQRIVVFAVQV